MELHKGVLNGGEHAGLSIEKSGFKRLITLSVKTEAEGKLQSFSLWKKSTSQASERLFLIKPLTTNLEQTKVGS